jgi:hypothetical protein
MVYAALPCKTISNCNFVRHWNPANVDRIENFIASKEAINMTLYFSKIRMFPVFWWPFVKRYYFYRFVSYRFSNISFYFRFFSVPFRFRKNNVKLFRKVSRLLLKIKKITRENMYS